MAKLVLKSTTRMSLNDRFSAYRKNVSPTTTQIRQRVQQNRISSARNRRLAQQMANRPTVIAALKIKKKSLKQRLGHIGIQSRISFRGRGQSNRIRGGRFRDGGLRRGNLQRYMSYSSSVMNTKVRGKGNQRGGLRRGRGVRGTSFQGGMQFRGFGGRGQFRSNIGGRQRGIGQSRGMFVGRGRGPFGNRGRGRGGRGRGGNKPVPTREELDTQLDEYMAGSKSHLDADLDAYMAESNA